jgi:hypothetical protein
MGTIHNLANQCNAPVIGADATAQEDVEKLFERDEDISFF